MKAVVADIGENDMITKTSYELPTQTANQGFA